MPLNLTLKNNVKMANFIYVYICLLYSKILRIHEGKKQLVNLAKLSINFCRTLETSQKLTTIGENLTITEAATL